MHTFYFNHECLPACNDLMLFKNHLESTLTSFTELADEPSLKIASGIITEKLPSEMDLGGFTLADVINCISTKELKTIAYKYFTKYPIDENIPAEEEDGSIDESLLNEASDWMWENEQGALINVFYMFLYSGFNGLCISVPFIGHLAVHPIPIFNPGLNSKRDVPNLFGGKPNEAEIREEIESRNRKFLGTFDRLLEIVGTHTLAHGYKKDFFSLSPPEQESVITNFKKAKDRNLASPFLPDTQIIKDVSPQHGRCKVYELRIYQPSAIRVYFLEKEGCVYLASIGKKSDGEQDKDIKKAENQIFKMLATS